MTDEEMAEEQIKKWGSVLYPQMYPVALVKDFIRKAFLAGAEFGYEQGIGRLRYCCTCKKRKECKYKAESMYGICADWEIKEIENDF